MPEGKRPVLVTRPEPGAAETARRLTAMGYTPIVVPLLTVTKRTPILPTKVTAILVTSANGLVESIPAAPLLTVGDATAERARAMGHTNVTSAGRDAPALAELVQRLHPPPASLLLLSGARQNAKLTATLRAAGYRVLRRVTYATQPIATMGEVPASTILFFSPETARIFVRLVGTAPRIAECEALAISPATAAALSPLPWRRIRVASAPNQDALLALLP